LVSQPSASIWKAKTITIEIQYAGLRKQAVRSTPKLQRAHAITASTAGSVYPTPVTTTAPTAARASDTYGQEIGSTAL
jgi:hypothetical protein